MDLHLANKSHPPRNQHLGAKRQTDAVRRATFAIRAVQVLGATNGDFAQVDARRWNAGARGTLETGGTRTAPLGAIPTHAFVRHVVDSQNAALFVRAARVASACRAPTDPGFLIAVRGRFPKPAVVVFEIFPAKLTDSRILGAIVPGHAIAGGQIANLAHPASLVGLAPHVEFRGAR